MNLDKLKKIAGIFTGEKSLQLGVFLSDGSIDLDKSADQIVLELFDVINLVKEDIKKYSWMLWKVPSIYKPLIKEIVEAVKAIDSVKKISNEQKKELAMKIAEKIIFKLLPKYASYPFVKTVVKFVINKGIELILSKIKKGKIKSEVFNVTPINETFVAGSVR